MTIPTEKLEELLKITDAEIEFLEASVLHEVVQELIERRARDMPRGCRTRAFMNGKCLDCGNVHD